MFKTTTRIAIALLWFALILATTFSYPAFSQETGNDLQRGKQIYQTNCAMCHGPGGQPDTDSALVESMGIVPAKSWLLTAVRPWASLTRCQRLGNHSAKPTSIRCSPTSKRWVASTTIPMAN